MRGANGRRQLSIFAVAEALYDKSMINTSPVSGLAVVKIVASHLFQISSFLSPDHWAAC